MSRRLLAVGCVALGLLGSTDGLGGTASATTITFEAIDLIDLDPGSDRWQFRYTVADRTFDAFQGFTILFDPLVFLALDPLPPPVNADWDVVTFAPAFPGDSALYDALALTAGASLADPFIIDAILAPNTAPPLSQIFAINAFDTDLNFLGVLEEGLAAPAQTTVVPEPATGILIGSAFILGWMGRRRGIAR